jgi:hypothetical protein
MAATETPMLPKTSEAGLTADDPVRRHSMSSALLVVFIGLALPATTTGPAWAQAGQRGHPLVTIEQFVRQDFFIQPGSGLKQVRIGDPMSRLAAVWGRPGRITRSGFLGRHKHWHYENGDGTRIVASGDRLVDRLTFHGSIASVYRTVDGARFGMARHQVRSIYGAPDHDDDGDRPVRMAYPGLGITFGFSRGALVEISVSAVSEPESG